MTTAFLGFFTHRDALIFCVFMQAIAVVFFGLSQNLVILTVIAFLLGLAMCTQNFFNDVIYAYTKTAPESQVLAQKLGVVCYVVGLVLGLSGFAFLSYPGEAGITSGRIFDEFPFLLACILTSVVLIIGTILLVFRLQDS
jgi:hypothetical protein